MIDFNLTTVSICPILFYCSSLLKYKVVPNLPVQDPWNIFDLLPHTLSLHLDE